ncbi:hypothetical protein [Thermomonospora amylolytica]|uniref:hypothetical protein n=1 Tax=Thermomonospora amylolytica TaxID=1411117 RepID=UPI000E6C5C66|nr:hypothetical protein [Thermomonospora amylolytica]
MRPERNARNSTAPDLALPGLREVYQAYVRAAAELEAMPGPLQAELWASAQLAALEKAAPHEAGHRMAVGDLIAELHRARTPATRTFLLAIAAMGPEWSRRAAAKAAAALTKTTTPSWTDALGKVTPGPVWLLQEGPLDGDRIICEFRYTPTEAGDQAGPHHALAVRLTPDTGIPTEIIVVGDVPALMADARKAVQAELCTIQPLARQTAAHRLRSALTTAHPLPEDCHPPLPFARHRASVL